jgi:hypothetical protein
MRQLWPNNTDIFMNTLQPNSILNVKTNPVRVPILMVNPTPNQLWVKLKCTVTMHVYYGGT